MAKDNGSIKRSKHNRDNPYKQISLALLQDDSISFEARGVMCYLLSKPDNWEVRVDDIIKASNAGEAKVRRIIHELIDAGYMTQRTKTRGENGHWVWSPYELFEFKEDNPNHMAVSHTRETITRSPKHGEPQNKDNIDRHNIENKINIAPENSDAPNDDPDTSQASKLTQGDKQVNWHYEWGKQFAEAIGMTWHEALFGQAVQAIQALDKVVTLDKQELTQAHIHSFIRYCKGLIDNGTLTGKYKPKRLNGYMGSGRAETWYSEYLAQQANKQATEQRNKQVAEMNTWV